MNRYSGLWLLLVALLGACTDRRSGVPAWRPGPAGAVAQALPAVDTSPGDATLAPFGEAPGGTPTYGQTITAPNDDHVLQGFTITTATVPATTTFRGELFAWDGAKATGASLFESGPMTPAAAAPQTFSFDMGPGGQVLTAGGQYVLFLTTSKDDGTGNGALAARDDDPYPGGRYVFTDGDASTWTTAAWSDLGGSADL